MAFPHGCLCPNSPLVKGQQPLDWIPPNPGDLISKLTLITSAQVLSPNVTISSGSRMDMNCGDTIPPRTDGNMRVVGRQGRRGGWMSFDAAWPPGLLAGWTQEKCLHGVDGACAWTRLQHCPWRLHANVFPVTAPSVLIVAHEGHHCWSPDRLGSRPLTVDRGSEDRVLVWEGSLRTRRSRGRFLNIRGLEDPSESGPSAAGDAARVGGSMSTSHESVTPPSVLRGLGRSLWLLSQTPCQARLAQPMMSGQLRLHPQGRPV